MSRAFLKNDMRGAFGANGEEDIGQYGVDFREVIQPRESERKEHRFSACDLKIDFHGKGAPPGGAQMYLHLDLVDAEKLLPLILAACKAQKEYIESHPEMRPCSDCKGPDGEPTGCKDGKIDVPPEQLEQCETCKGTGEVRA